MMKDYIFGIDAEAYLGVPTDFFLNLDNTNSEGEHNPYHKAWLRDPKNRATTNEQGRITSIPSPYARMHLTDLAFEEANCGLGILNNVEQAQLELAPDYLKAMSHCLDMFELMYHSNEFDLAQKGITLHKLDLVSTDTLDPQERAVLYDHQGNLTNYGKYIRTLDIFRASYLSTISENREGIQVPYYFDFKSLYIFKHNGKTFAATSPFTGFFTVAGCDLSEANLVVNGRTLLSNDPATWCDHKGRGREFIEFMYLLLKDYGLDTTFANLFKSIESVVKRDNAWFNRVQNTRFVGVPEYEKFNMRAAGLQNVPGSDIYLRPDGLDCSYLKFLLYLQEPVDLTIRDEEYRIPLNERTFAGNLLQWVGVNDILSDALFVLPYDVNENYIVVPYCDTTRGNLNLRRCLVPIKSEILEFFPLDTLVNNLTITRTQPEVFVAELKINLGGGNFTVLRREYHTDDRLAQFPKGKLIMGSAMKPFAFGVYPFVKSANATNIYKVLFYNVFDGEYKLNFFHKDQNGRVIPYLQADHHANKTNDVNEPAIPLNCEYHHLNNKFGLEYAELTVNGYTSLIVPRLRQIQEVQNRVNVSIDLGTSNTYVAYSVVDIIDNAFATICQIKTNHVTADGVKWNELTFMNKSCEAMHRPNGVNECNDDDLVVRLSDDASQKASSEMLDHQLCEFIPSKIDPTGQSSYSFPIPSVLNFLREGTQRRPLDQNHVPNPLVNAAIPFAYYERGTRQLAGAAPSLYDVIGKGNVFKWYRVRDVHGNVHTRQGGQSAFKAFIRELLFIVRCHLISQGYKLSNVNVYWSYPLSFESALLEDYKVEWQQAFEEVIDRNSANRVHYTCESRSPIYSCINPVNLNDLTLLVDIGGGSTDVIGYKQMNPLFVSSTMFAGNALYLCGDLNNHMFRSGQGMRDTLLYRYVSKLHVMKDAQVSNNGGVVNKPVSMSDDLATIMNYGFVKYPAEFRSIFTNYSAEFMLKLHNSALIYHIAQLCHAKSPDAAPRDIYLTGNGSKQLSMNSGYMQMIRDIFAFVYRDNETASQRCANIGIQFPDRPKAATAEGTLKGLQNQAQTISLDGDAMGGSYIAYGDGKHVLDNTAHGALLVQGCEIDNVKENAKKFVDMFYDIIYTTPCPSITKEAMLEAVESCSIGGGNNLINDSYFLRLMSEVMERLSVQLAPSVQ